jgi:hypothetical protein
MHILCLDDDINFCRMLKVEAEELQIQISFAKTLEEDLQKLMNQEYQAHLIDSKFLENIKFNKKNPLSVIFGSLPSVKKLEELKQQKKITLVGGKPMSSNEAHYLLAKLCQKANKLEPYCDWLHEIPEKLFEDYHQLAYERLSQIHFILQKKKKNLSLQEWDELQNIVHKIAGSAGIYGRSMASKICKEMEIQLKNKDYLHIDLESFYRQLFLYIQ